MYPCLLFMHFTFHVAKPNFNFCTSLLMHSLGMLVIDSNLLPVAGVLRFLLLLLWRPMGLREEAEGGRHGCCRFRVGRGGGHHGVLHRQDARLHEANTQKGNTADTGIKLSNSLSTYCDCYFGRVSVKQVIPDSSLNYLRESRSRFERKSPSRTSRSLTL